MGVARPAAFGAQALRLEVWHRRSPVLFLGCSVDSGPWHPRFGRGASWTPTVATAKTQHPPVASADRAFHGGLLPRYLE